MPTLLVIDDEPNIVFSVEECLSSPTLRVTSAGTAREGLEKIRQRRPNAVLLDVRLPDLSGLEAYDKIREMDASIPVIVMTAFAKTETAIEATRRGAFDYLIKPVDFKQLQESVDRALEVSRLQQANSILINQHESTLPESDRIIGLSPAMQEVYKAIGRIAPQNSTVLILGESGTGKELVARAIHQYSQRSNKPFLAINCASFPESLLESELFGHERGAFLGAEEPRIGKCELSHSGTIFLDEIGDMSPATQAKALRLLEQQQLERLGGNTTIQTDVRFITATNQNLEQLVAEGKFRQDLYYRLNGFTVQLPPLRERQGDIPRLAEQFIKLFNYELGKGVRTVSPEALAVLEAHSWPGNVREFQSALKFAMVHVKGDTITVECLPESCRSKHSKPLVISLAAPASAGKTEIESSDGPQLDVGAMTRKLLGAGQGNLYRTIGQAVDRIVIEEVLQQAAGNQQQAAEWLGISRMTLRTKLRSLGLLADRSDAP